MTFGTVIGFRGRWSVRIAGVLSPFQRPKTARLSGLQAFDVPSVVSVDVSFLSDPDVTRDLACETPREVGFGVQWSFPETFGLFETLAFPYDVSFDVLQSLPEAFSFFELVIFLILGKKE